MKKSLAVAVNVAIGIVSLAAWVYMAFLSKGPGTLAAGGLASLRFFTVLSNLFNGCVALFYASWLLRGQDIAPAQKTLKLTATTAVGLTFVTVMAFLGPVFGYAMMFNGANLWFHLLLPVASFASFMFLERGCRIPLKNTLWALLPPALYGTGYLTNIGVNGIGAWPNTNDFYGFLHWGNGVGALVACVILLVTWGISLVLGGVGKAINTKECKE